MVEEDSVSDVPNQPIRVLVVDDEALVRAGVRLVLSHAPDIDVVAEAGNGAEGAELALRCRVDVVLMDIRMPGMNRLEEVERVAALAPSARVLMLTTMGEDEYITRALTAGAVGGSCSRTPCRGISSMRRARCRRGVRARHASAP
jgi:DNA-binding NarL/FixJ family response regulator